MKKIIGRIMIMALLVMPLSGILTAKAATEPYWNTSGNYVVNMNYLGTDYAHDMSLTQDNLGNLTGNGGSPSGSNVYTWTITSGSVSGNAIDFLADYTATADAVTPQTVLHITGTVAPDGTISGNWSDNYQGGDRSGTVATVSGSAVLLGTLAAEDFGVVSYDTGLGMIKGYTAGFGVSDATFAGATSVVVQLYAGASLLQTNTAILPKFNADITGAQFSSPFDVSGNFDYATDGYWTNAREAEYGQSVAATKVVATVTLANGKVVTAENTTLSGDPTTIFPVAETSWIDAKWGVMIDLDTLLATATTTRKDQNTISKAIEQIKSSVNTNWWSDASHLWAKKGLKVFEQEQKAIETFNQLMKDKKSLVAPLTIKGFMDRLVAIDRGLAMTQITDSTAQDGKPSEITKANADIAKGDTNASLGKAKQAIENYQSAWEHAIKALK